MKNDIYLLKDKNVFLYYLYSAIYGLYPINVVVALFFIHKGLNFAEIGIVVAVFQITAILFEIPTGYVADKVSRRLSIIYGLIILIITSTLWTFSQNYIHFAVLAAIWMLGFTFISGSFEAYIYDYLKKIRKEKSYDSILSKSSSLSFLFGAIGNILGAWLFSIKPEFPYYLQILIFSISLVIVLIMKYDKVTKIQDRNSIKLLGGLQKIKSSKELLWITIFISIFFSFNSFFTNSINSPYVLSLDLFSIKYLGIFFALMSAYKSIVSGNFAKMKNMLPENFIILLLLGIQFLSLLGMGYLYGILGLISYILFVTIIPFQSLLTNSFTQKHVSSDIRATTISSINMINALFSATTGIMLGIIFDKRGFEFSFIAVGIYLLVSTTILIFWKLSKKIEII